VCHLLPSRRTLSNVAELSEQQAKLPKTQLHVHMAASEYSGPHHQVMLFGLIPWIASRSYQAIPAIPASTVDESQNQRNALQVSANFRARDLPVTQNLQYPGAT
jgi:hypothetical protein